MITTVIKDQKLTIAIDDKFKFYIHKEIRKAYELINENTKEVIINFEKVDDLDSSAIGMLMQIKERCEPDKIVLKIIGCDDEMKHILCAFHLNEYFDFL